jgi:hypothetical protein
MNFYYLIFFVDSKDTVEAQQGKSATTGVKIPKASKRMGNLVLLENTYMAEFPADVDVKNHFETIKNSLREAKLIDTSEIQIRSIIRSSLFNGASFTVTTTESIEASKVLESAIDIQPVYLIPAPRVFTSSFASDKTINTDPYLLNAFDLTGVTQVHQQLQNFGAGVRVSDTQNRRLLIICFMQRNASFHKKLERYL